MEQTIEPRADNPRVDWQPSAGAAVSWPAIIAGAFVAVAVSLVLLTLGAGLGFAAISPWPGHGAPATTFAVTSAIWLIVTQWLSSGFGGYVAGRLRTRWIGTHTHEVFFRDTAHGLITWAVATVVVAAVLAGAMHSPAIQSPMMEGADSDAAHAAAAQVAVYTALSMLVGAFIAGVSAALGGRLRDQHV
jgi:hypothetical protein